jgi:hypothetical protein
MIFQLTGKACKPGQCSQVGACQPFQLDLEKNRGARALARIAQRALGLLACFCRGTGLRAQGFLFICSWTATHVQRRAACVWRPAFSGAVLVAAHKGPAARASPVAASREVK